MVSVSLVFAIAAILVAGAALQAAVGFGMGLFSIPLFVGLGLELPHAVATFVAAALVQTSTGLYGLRREIQPALSLRVGTAQVLAVPLGVFVMSLVMTSVPAPTLRAGVGATVIVLVTLRTIVRATPRAEAHFGTATIAGLSSGFLAGLIGMAGPPLVLFAMSNQWSKDRFRAFLWTQLLISGVVLLAMLVWRFGSEIWIYFALGCACTPAIWLGAWSGVWATRNWKFTQVMRAALLTLYGVGLQAMLSAL
jgi:uncharacterized membrane protein YfcA